MTSPKTNCDAIKQTLIDARLDGSGHMADRDALRHVDQCDDCRSFAGDLDPITKDIAKFKRSVFDRIGSTPEGRSRMHKTIERWALEESGVRRTTSSKSVTRDQDGWASKFFSWAFPGTPGMATFRLIVQGVCGLGLVLFIAFVVHFSMSKRPMAQHSEPKKSETIDHSPSVPEQATSAPTSEPFRKIERK